MLLTISNGKSLSLTQILGMRFSEKNTYWRAFIIFCSFCIVALILYNTYAFFQIFKNEERDKMRLWASSIKAIDRANLSSDDIELPMMILENNTTIPILQTQDDVIINTANLPAGIENDSLALRKYFNRIAEQNDPILLEYAPGQYQKIYYGNSNLLNQLKYYPIALILILFLFVLLIWNYYRSTKMASQNKLWAGMAKETAHQIGTPLSSLLGWVEIMRHEPIDQDITEEIEKDVLRLQTIADRFSKIGSEPVLVQTDIVESTRQAFDYLTSRYAQQLHYTYEAPNEPLYAQINPELHSWTIENLVKNAIDAMKGKGNLKVAVQADAQQIQILVEDNGKGIPKNLFKSIFEPGFTTKKRGWGLGLSLTKRIVEEYHSGKIKVLHSEIGKGTTFQVSLPRQIV